MRTTLTLDDDVAALLARARQSRDVRLREVVNDALRRGLAELDKPPATVEEPHRIEPAPGRPRLRNMDDVADTLAFAEGEDRR